MSDPKVFSFISGKGGTGKTTVCLSMGFLLASAGYKVRLIDADLATHGLSHFFDGFGGVTSIQTTSSSESVAAPISIPLSSQPNAGSLQISVLQSSEVLDVSAQSESGVRAVRALPTTVQEARRTCDVVLVDCQAGISPVLDAILPQSDHLIVVTEADPVSVRAVEGLVETLPDEFKGRLRGAVSRVFPEEIQYYRALTDYLKGIRFAGMLPFDRDVRQAFFSRRAPIDVGRPGPFSIAVKEMLLSVDPVIGNRLGKLEEFSRFSPPEIKDDVDELARMRNEAERRYVEATFFGRRQKLRIILGGFVAVLTVAVALLFGAFDIISERTALFFSVASAAVGLGVSSLAYYARSPAPLIEAEQSRRLLNDLENRLREYRVVATERGTSLYSGDAGGQRQGSKILLEDRPPTQE